MASNINKRERIWGPAVFFTPSSTSDYFLFFVRGRASFVSTWVHGELLSGVERCRWPAVRARCPVNLETASPLELRSKAFGKAVWLHVCKHERFVETGARCTIRFLAGWRSSREAVCGEYWWLGKRCGVGKPYPLEIHSLQTLFQL